MQPALAGAWRGVVHAARQVGCLLKPADADGKATTQVTDGCSGQQAPKHSDYARTAEPSIQASQGRLRTAATHLAIVLTDLL